MKSDVGPNHCAGCAGAKGYRLPVHHSFFEGRSDLDWFLSIRDYLRWRAGSAWRPIRHRGPCVVDSYRDALHVITQAYHAPAQVAPLAAAKKPVRSAPSPYPTQGGSGRDGLRAAAGSNSDVTVRLKHG
jgi:hypothetical protein